jgi:DNA-binding response OmpR family regulator
VSRQILVVEDEYDLAVTCSRLLTRTGWQVTTVGSRQAGLTALADGAPPALAIVDRQLPDGDGLDVVRAARAHGTPAIVVSGQTSAANRRDTLAEGATFLGKPFSIQQLLETVRSLAGEPPRS